MNKDRMLSLAESAQDYAKTYTSVCEALIKEGVPQDEARSQAMQAALMAAWYEAPADKDTPPWQ